MNVYNNAVKAWAGWLSGERGQWDKKEEHLLTIKTNF